MEGFELLNPPLGFQNGSARLLTGDLVVRDIERWCRRKAEKGGVKPVMAVIFFNTGTEAVDYVKIKAHVAARVSSTVSPSRSGTGLRTIAAMWHEILPGVCLAELN
jgi:hypothetical protein